MSEPTSAGAVDAWIAERQPDRFAHVRLASVEHRDRHGCDVYPSAIAPLLGVLAASNQPKRILELGTGLGYSALWLAYGGSGAILDTVERDAEHAELARARLAEEGYAERVLVHEASAPDLLDELAAGYDFVFYDADPDDLEVFRAHLPRLLAPRALLVSSNLFLGQFVPDLPGLDVAAAYRKAILADERLLTSFLPGGAAVSVRR